MAKIEKSEESWPQLFFDFTYKKVPQLFPGAPWAEKMTFSQKTGHDRFGWTQFLHEYILVEAKIMVWALDKFLELRNASDYMCLGLWIGLDWVGIEPEGIGD